MGTGDRWVVELSGELIDLHDAVDLFRDGSPTIQSGVLPHREAVILMADDFELLQAIPDVQIAAERMLVGLNAVLYLEDRDRKPLSISGVHKRRANGTWDIGMIVSGGSYRLRGARLRGQPGAIGPTQQSNWLQAGLRDEIVADVLSYLRGEPDWIALYKAYEAMNKDANALRPTKGNVTGWASKAKISAFTGGAQLHRHSKTWCDRHDIKSEDSMGFDEASNLIRSMIKVWLEWRA
jgi:hypothetical protein